MPPKKKSTKKKKVGTKKPVLVIPIDDKLPVLCDLKASVLVDTIRTGDTLSLKRLVTHYDYGNALSKTDVNGSTPLHIAVKNNDIKTVQLLLDYEKIDINAFEIQTIGGNTALHHACIEKNSSIVQLLLKYGAKPNIRSNSVIGETPLQVCCKLGFIEGAKHLIHSGGHILIDMKDNYGNDASFWANKYRQRELIQELSLPLPKAPTGEEFLALMIKRNPHFQLPSIKIKVPKKKDKDGKKKK